MPGKDIAKYNKYKSYDISEPGFKYNLTNLNAALGLNQC